MEDLKERYKKNLEAIFMPHKKDWMNIGEEIITMENIRIPIRSIAMMKIQEKKPLRIVNFVAYFIFGCFLGLLEDEIPFLGILGVVFIIISLLGGTLEVVRYLMAEHQLQLRLLSGDVFCFYNRKLNFLREMMDILSKSLAGNKQIVNINVEQTVIDNHEGVIDMSYHYNPHVISGEGGNSVFIQGDGNQAMTVGAGSVTGDNNLHGHKQKNVVKSSLSFEEWNILTEYFTRRCQELGASDAHYRACAQMRQYSQRQDASGLKAFMKQVGKDVLRFVLGHEVGKTVTELLTRVLKS